MLGTFKTKKLLILGTFEIPDAWHFLKKLFILGTLEKTS